MTIRAWFLCSGVVGSIVSAVPAAAARPIEVRAWFVAGVDDHTPPRSGEGRPGEFFWSQPVQFEHVVTTTAGAFHQVLDQDSKPFYCAVPTPKKESQAQFAAFAAKEVLIDALIPFAVYRRRAEPMSCYEDAKNSGAFDVEFGSTSMVIGVESTRLDKPHPLASPIAYQPSARVEATGQGRIGFVLRRDSIFKRWVIDLCNETVVAGKSARTCFAKESVLYKGGDLTVEKLGAKVIIRSVAETTGADTVAYEVVTPINRPFNFSSRTSTYFAGKYPVTTTESFLNSERLEAPAAADVSRPGAL